MQKKYTCADGQVKSSRAHAQPLRTHLKLPRAHVKHLRGFVKISQCVKRCMNSLKPYCRTQKSACNEMSFRNCLNISFGKICNKKVTTWQLCTPVTFHLPCNGTYTFVHACPHSAIILILKYSGTKSLYDTTNWSLNSIKNTITKLIITPPKV